MLVGAEHLKVPLLGTAGFCLHGRWHPGAGPWHPGKGEDEEATPVTLLPVYSCSLELQLQKKKSKNPKDEVQTVPRTAKKPAPPWQKGGTGPQTASSSSSAPWGKWGGGLGEQGGMFWDNPSPSLCLWAVLGVHKELGKEQPEQSWQPCWSCCPRRGDEGGPQAKMVSSLRFLVRMVPGLCWASGWLASSGGHEDTGLSRMACLRS